MGRAMFPPCYLTCGQTTVEVMKIMASSFKRSHTHTAAHSGPNPAAGRRWPTPPPGTLGHSWASLSQPLAGSLLLSSGSWCTQGFVCAFQEYVSQSYVSSGGSMVGLMATSSKRLMPYPGLLHPETLPLQQYTANPYLHRRRSNTVLSQSLWGLRVLVYTRFVWALWASLAHMGFDSKK